MIRIALIFFLVCGIATTGCISSPSLPPVQGTYSIGETSLPSFTIPDAEVDSNLSEAGNITVEDLNFHSFAGDVHGVLIRPEHPLLGMVWVPGAGVPASGHIEHLRQYAEEGIVTLVVDVRGNGGLTPGYPMDLERDFSLFISEEWPQYYLIISDCIAAKEYLKKRFSVPVWIAGESNGGRYAVVAAGMDPEFAGYIGISTSGFNKIGLDYEEPARSFLLSIDPSVAIPNISSGPVILFHSPDDPVIPFVDGEILSRTAGTGSQFIRFNGTHGVNEEVDAEIIRILNDEMKKVNQ